jgi:hypothetical protein
MQPSFEFAHRLWDIGQTDGGAIHREGLYRLTAAFDPGSTREAVSEQVRADFVGRARTLLADRNAFIEERAVASAVEKSSKAVRASERELQARRLAFEAACDAGDPDAVNAARAAIPPAEARLAELQAALASIREHHANALHRLDHLPKELCSDALATLRAQAAEDLAAAKEDLLATLAGPLATAVGKYVAAGLMLEAMNQDQLEFLARRVVAEAEQNGRGPFGTAPAREGKKSA